MLVFVGVLLFLIGLGSSISLLGVLSELKQLEKELANINKFKDEISLFKELMFKKFGTKSEQELDRPARIQSKSL